jgi:hypothetical protein
LATIEEKLGNEEDQTLAVLARKGKSNKEVNSHKKPHGLQKTQILKRITQIKNATYARRWFTLQ